MEISLAWLCFLCHQLRTVVLSCWLMSHCSPGCFKQKSPAWVQAARWKILSYCVSEYSSSAAGFKRFAVFELRAVTSQFFSRSFFTGSVVVADVIFSNQGARVDDRDPQRIYHHSVCFIYSISWNIFFENPFSVHIVFLGVFGSCGNGVDLSCGMGFHSLYF